MAIFYYKQKQVVLYWPNSDISVSAVLSLAVDFAYGFQKS